jgi:hypothetical protein
MGKTIGMVIVKARAEPKGIPEEARPIITPAFSGGAQVLTSFGMTGNVQAYPRP